MANQEQLSILKRGVRVWNQWRLENQDIGYRIDLSGADLRLANLSGARLGRADLSSADLDYALQLHFIAD